MEYKEISFNVTREQFNSYIDNFVDKEAFYNRDERKLLKYSTSPFYKQRPTPFNELKKEIDRIDYTIARFNMEQSINYDTALNLDKISKGINENFIQLKKNKRYLTENKKNLNNDAIDFIKSNLYEDLYLMTKQITLIDIVLNINPHYIFNLLNLGDFYKENPNEHVNILKNIQENKVRKESARYDFRNY